MSRSKKPMNPSAENALDRMKQEVASELGISEKVSNQGWSTMTSADCGRVGGHMVRRMIENYENSLAGTATTGSTAIPSTTSRMGMSGQTLTAQYDANNKP